MRATSPPVKIDYNSFKYHNARDQDVTAGLTAEQLAAIQRSTVPLVVVQDPAGKNIGAATWTYNIADGALDFLAEGEQLELTYVAEVDNNYPLNNEKTFKTFTITITGTNDTPIIATTNSGFTELPGTTNADIDHAGGTITFEDVDLTDRPTVSTAFASYTYRDAQGHDVTLGLNSTQRADIDAVKAVLTLTPAPGNGHNGSVTWSYDVADAKFDFLAAGEVLTLTYIATVDDGHGLGGTAEVPVTVTITGTNDLPVIETGSPSIAFAAGKTTPGGVLAQTDDPTSGTFVFTDTDLTDTHTVSTRLASADLPGRTVAPTPLRLFETALSASIASDSTDSGTGTIHWRFADLPVWVADFIPLGETLTLTYEVTVRDSQNTTSTQLVTVTITGTDTPAVVWIATTTSGQPSGGLWSTALNWETGTVPTAADDTIIITDQLHGLTPSYPVTIDAQTEAVAKTLTMNDFGPSGSAAPKLINLNKLTVVGEADLLNDAIVENLGTIDIGGPLKVLGDSVIENSGTLNLGQGGEFKDHAGITNLAGGVIDLKAARSTTSSRSSTTG